MARRKLPSVPTAGPPILTEAQRLELAVENTTAGQRAVNRALVQQQAATPANTEKTCNQGQKKWRVGDLKS